VAAAKAMTVKSTLKIVGRAFLQINAGGMP
jgi:hypothetical protein